MRGFAGGTQVAIDSAAGPASAWAKDHAGRMVGTKAPFCGNKRECHNSVRPLAILGRSRCPSRPYR